MMMMTMMMTIMMRIVITIVIITTRTPRTYVAIVLIRSQMSVNLSFFVLNKKMFF